MKLVKKKTIIMVLIIALYLMCWLLFYTSKFRYIRMAENVENYFYYFQFKALIVGIILYLIPYEKIKRAVNSGITDKVKTCGIFTNESQIEILKISVLLIINILGSVILGLYIYNGNMTWGQKDHLILLLNFIYPIFVLKIISESQRWAFVVKMLMSSGIVYFNIGIVIVLSGKYSLAGIVLVIFYISMFLLMKNEKATNRIGMCISFALGCILFIIPGIINGKISNYIYNFTKDKKINNLQEQPFARIEYCLSIKTWILFLILLCCIFILGCILCKMLYNLNYHRAIIIFAIVLLFGMTNLYLVLAERGLVPYCTLNTFRNEINLLLMAIAFRLAKIAH